MSKQHVLQRAVHISPVSSCRHSSPREAMGVMSMLVLLGVCAKVRLQYTLTGHSHVDNDGDIGIASTHLAVEDLPSYTVFADELKKAFGKGVHGFTEVERIVGIMDFDAMFPMFKENFHNIDGENK